MHPRIGRKYSSRYARRISGETSVVGGYHRLVANCTRNYMVITRALLQPRIHDNKTDEGSNEEEDNATCMLACALLAACSRLLRVGVHRGGETRHRMRS